MAYALRNCGDMAQRLLKTMQEDGPWNDRMSWCLVHILSPYLATTLPYTQFFFGVSFL